MKILRLIGLVVIVALLSPETARAEASATVGRAIDEWLGASAAQGVAAAWIDADGVTFVSRGRFAAGDAREITPDTFFEIGSLTKAFTAALLARAREEDKIGLSSSIGAPFAGSAVTFGQLATHTAGLPLMPAKPAGSPPGPARMEALGEAWRQIAPTLRPSEVHYSNFGYAVLGHATAALWDEAFAEALRGRVLLPLGLRESRVDWREVPAERLAPGHNASGRAPNLDFRGEAPAGGMVSTARELARFVEAQLRLGGVSAPWLRRTHEPRAALPGAARRIGLGWMIDDWPAGRVLSLTGATAGYAGFVAFVPERRAGIVLLSNSNERSLEPLGRGVLQQLLARDE